MPAVFAIGHFVFSNSQTGLFGAFGSFALLLLVDFPGRPRTRLYGYIGLFVVGVCFIALGTVASSHKVAAVVSMALVGFAVLFAGIFLPQAAIASTAALLLFVLPVAVVQPASEVGSRLVGWTLAGAVCIPACMLIWRTPWHDDLRRRLSAAVSAVGTLAKSHSDGRLDPDGLAIVIVRVVSATQAIRGNAVSADELCLRSRRTCQAGGSRRVGRRERHIGEGPGFVTRKFGRAQGDRRRSRDPAA